MKLLLDTCAVIWWFLEDPRLRAPTVRLIDDQATENAVSIVSLWEIAMKLRLGRLNMPAAVLDENIRRAGWQLLPVRPRHLHVLETLPSHHRDPFDHLLISQAIVEDMTLVTADAHIPHYAVKCVAC